MSWIRHRYRVLEPLGRGAMGSVYAVEDVLDPDRPTALKALWPGPSGELAQTLRREFGVMAAVRHPLLCRVYDFGRLPAGIELPGQSRSGDHDGLFLTRDRLFGSDLRGAAERVSRDPATVCRWCAWAARGMDVLHRAGLRHGDFKPDNAIVLDGNDRHGPVRLIDFGLVIAEDARRMAGTLVYLAPEIARGRPVDRRADLYSLAVVLFELLTGQLPSGERRGDELIAWHQDGVRPLLGEIRSDLPGELVELVDRMLAADPDRRVPTGLEVAAALDRVAAAVDRQAGRATARRPVRDVPAIAFAPVGQVYVTELERAFDRRRRGAGGPAMIEVRGDAGSGKTTITTELAWRVQLAGGEVVRVAFASSRGALSDLLEQVSSLGVAEAEPALQRMQSGMAEPAQIALAIAGALVACGRRWPLLVVLDDLDRADAFAVSLAPLIAAALPAEAAVTLVATITDGPGGQLWAGEVAATSRMAVEPLGAAEVADIVRHVLGRNDPALVHWLLTHTAGNLLHLVHVLGALAERGFPGADAAAALDLPTRLDAWEVELVGRQPAVARQLVDALAVIGESVDLADAARIAGGRASMADAARGLVDSGLVRVRDDAVTLARPSTARAVLDRLDRARIAELSRRAIDVVGDRIRSPQLVQWWVDCGDTSGAVTAASKLGGELAAAGDHAGAALVGWRALARAGERLPEQGAQLAVEVTEWALASGDSRRALAAWALWREHRDAASGDEARAELAGGRAHSAAGDFDVAEELFERVIAAQPADDLGIRAAHLLVEQHIRRGYLERAEALAEQALAVAGSHPTGALLRAGRHLARGLAGQDGALAELEQLASSATDAPVRAAALHCAGRVAYAQGLYLAAETHYRAALDAAQAAGDLMRAATLRMNLAAMAFSFGNFSESLAHYLPAVSILDALGQRSTTLLARRNLGHLLIELGQYEQAELELAAASRLAESVGNDVQALGIVALTGVLSWRRGDIDGGRDRLERARRGFADRGDERRCAETLLDLVELELDDGSPRHRALARAESLLADARAMKAAISDGARRGRTLAYSAIVHAERDDHGRARAVLAELADAIDTLESRRAAQIAWNLHRLAGRAWAILGQSEPAEASRAKALAHLDATAGDLPEAQRLSYWLDRRRRPLRRQAAGSPSWPVSSSSSALPEAMVDKLFRLLDIYRRMSTERDVERLLELVMDTAVDLSGCERGFVLLATGAAQLEVAVARNLAPGELDSIEAGDPDALPYSRSIAERVFASGELVVSNDPRVDPRFGAAESVHLLRLGRVVCVPIHCRGRVAGVLYLEARHVSRLLGDDDVRLLMAFGDQVAVVLDSARLVADNAARAERLEEARQHIARLLAEKTELLELRTEELATARREYQSMSRALVGSPGAFGLIGRSPAMDRVFQLIERAAATSVPVLILGESGTGKELVARALHQYGTRRDQPMVSLNCGAVAESILQSELFGHVRGAFTGADKAKRGLFEAADGGTLFLDEVGDMPLPMQAGLLRALQEGVIRPLGATEDRPVDVRVLAATHRRLDDMVEEGAFREDLYYRLHVLLIEVPPLRERREDIPLLCEHLMKGICERTGTPRRALTRKAIAELARYDWPGNVRQLEHTLTQLCVLAEGETVGDLAVRELIAGAAARSQSSSSRDDHRQRERTRMLEALEANGWNRSRAAEALGMARRTFYRRLAEYDIQ